MSQSSNRGPVTGPPMTKREYVLGTGDDELARLGLQHRLWADAAHQAWRIGGIRPGLRVLDVGCGPGFAAFELAQIVALSTQIEPALEGWATARGEVVGVDESATYVEWLNSQAESRGIAHACRAVVGDVQGLNAALPGERSSFDMAYARWVLCFVKSPESVVAGVAGLLKSGATFCIHDYFNYEGMALAPRCASHTRAVAATARSWRDRGGDPDVVGRLPAILAQHGLEVFHMQVHQRIARPHETMWAWPFIWWRTFTPKLVQMNYLTQADQDEFLADIDRATADPHSFWFMPPVFEIVCRKC